MAKVVLTRLAVGSLHLGWQALLFGVPLVLLVAISFWTVENYRLTPAFTLDGYDELLAKPRYLDAVATRCASH